MRFVATKTPSWAGGGQRVRRLHDSDLDWTVVRPPRLTDKPKTGSYRTAYGQKSEARRAHLARRHRRLHASCTRATGVDQADHRYRLLSIETKRGPFNFDRQQISSASDISFVASARFPPTRVIEC